MSKPPPLPDLDDDADFRSRMSPLVRAILPDDRKPGIPGNGIPENRTPGLEEEHSSNLKDEHTAGLEDSRSPGFPDIRNIGLVEAAEAQARIEAKRGVKKRFEYLIPERVGRALADDAAARGVSATVRLLEVLRDSGYPVIPEDLIDLRKMPRR